jgi:lipopolysaccharide export system protein LptC
MRAPATPDGRFRLSAVRPKQRHLNAAYSGLVRTLKIVLPAVAVAIAALILLWPQFQPRDVRFRVGAVAIGPEDLENLRMVNARFQGLDAHNQPYVVTADQATQEAGNSDATDLTHPKADIALADGTWAVITADEGRYRRESRRLLLTGRVNLFQDGGYEIQTTEAEIDLVAGQAAGNAPVAGQGPDMQLRGQGFRIYDKGARIVVTGPAQLVLTSRPETPLP